MPNVELTNMCMIYDKKHNKVLVQDRLKSWKGITFPGGHMEEGESIVDSTIREIKEETGLSVRDLKLCGIIHWVHDMTGDRYFVFSFKTEQFSGELLDTTDEGRIFWVDKEELPFLPLARGFGERLPMFFEEGYNEGFGTWNEHVRGDMVWK
ncbi:MAG: hydrolase [Paenibacillaceae bacterium]|nr:hydrolase [Paenibacillaceae bacterium]